MIKQWVERLIERMMEPFSWDIVLYAGDHEVHRNTITGLYRHRVFDFAHGKQVFGPWTPGLPKPEDAPVDLDEMLSPMEMARMLSPWHSPIPANDRA
jgi:hypothetical protein